MKDATKACFVCISESFSQPPIHYATMATSRRVLTVPWLKVEVLKRLRNKDTTAIIGVHAQVLEYNHSTHFAVLSDGSVTCRSIIPESVAKQVFKEQDENDSEDDERYVVSPQNLPGQVVVLAKAIVVPRVDVQPMHVEIVVEDMKVWGGDFDRSLGLKDNRDLNSIADVRVALATLYGQALGIHDVRGLESDGELTGDAETILGNVDVGRGRLPNIQEMMKKFEQVGNDWKTFVEGSDSGRSGDSSVERDQIHSGDEALPIEDVPPTQTQTQGVPEIAGQNDGEDDDGEGPANGDTVLRDSETLPETQFETQDVDFGNIQRRPPIATQMDIEDEGGDMIETQEIETEEKENSRMMWRDRPLATQFEPAEEDEGEPIFDTEAANPNPNTEKSLPAGSHPDGRRRPNEIETQFEDDEITEQVIDSNESGDLLETLGALTSKRRRADPVEGQVEKNALRKRKNQTALETGTGAAALCDRPALTEVVFSASTNTKKETPAEKHHRRPLPPADDGLLWNNLAKGEKLTYTQVENCTETEIELDETPKYDSNAITQRSRGHGINRTKEGPGHRGVAVRVKRRRAARNSTKEIARTSAPTDEVSSTGLAKESNINDENVEPIVTNGDVGDLRISDVTRDHGNGGYPRVSHEEGAITAPHTPTPDNQADQRELEGKEEDDGREDSSFGSKAKQVLKFVRKMANLRKTRPWAAIFASGGSKKRRRPNEAPEREAAEDAIPRKRARRANGIADGRSP